MAAAHSYISALSQQNPSPPGKVACMRLWSPPNASKAGDTPKMTTCAFAHPEVGDEAGGVAVAHDDLVDVHSRDVQPRPRQQIARVPHLGQTNTMVALE